MRGLEIDFSLIKYKVEVQKEEKNARIINYLNVTFPVGLGCFSSTHNVKVIKES